MTLSQTERRFAYETKDHAAAHTDEFVFHQLIPYIGNKRKLLTLIQQAIRKTDVCSSAVFLDVFAGSGVVSRMVKEIGFRVIANDWEPYSVEINRCYIECSRPPDFPNLGGYENAIHILNELPPSEDWVTTHLCPPNDADFDTLRDRMFYTRANGMRIDAMRSQIETWETHGVINALEKACLLAPLLYQTCYTSNTSGVFKGFHNGWGGKTGTALYRILSDLQLKPAVFHDNRQSNVVYGMQDIELVKHLAGKGETVDIAYLDPPYNQHPYGSNYHVLNSVALWDKPPLTPHIEGRNKSAIREDWRTERRSAYNYRGAAEKSYAALIDALPAKHILTSYSTDGMIALEALVGICVARGRTDMVFSKYKRYRVSTQRFSSKPVNVEFVLIVDTSRRHASPTVGQLCESIRRIEADALLKEKRAEDG